MSLFQFIKQLVEWKRAKNCLASRHSWKEVRHPTRPNVIQIKCKHCDFVGYQTWDPRTDEERKMTHHGLVNIPLSFAFITSTLWLPYIEKISWFCGLMLPIIGVVVGIVQVARLFRADK
jgi:hypothetical protein